MSNNELNTGDPGKTDSVSQPTLFSPAVQPIAILLAANALAIAAAALSAPGPPIEAWAVPLIIFAAIGSLLPVGIGAALMVLRNSRFVIELVAVASGLTVMLTVRRLLAIESRPSTVILATGVVSFELGLLWLGTRLASRNAFPQSVRLATTALVFKLAIVGLLAAAFVPAERNPLALVVPEVGEVDASKSIPSQTFD